MSAIMGTHDPAGEFNRITERYRQMADEELLHLAPEKASLTPLAQDALASEMRQRGLKVESPKIDSSKEVSRQRPRAPARPEAKPVFSEHFGEQPRADAPKSAREIWARTNAFEPDSPDLDSADADSVSEGASTDRVAEQRDSDAADANAPDPYAEDRELVTICTVYSLRDALKVQELLDVAAIPFFMGKEKATDVRDVISNFADGVDVQIMQIGIPWARSAMQNYFPKDEPPDVSQPEPEELPVRCPKCGSIEVVLHDAVCATEGSPEKFEWTCSSCGNEWEDDGIAKAG